MNKKSGKYKSMIKTFIDAGGKRIHIKSTLKRIPKEWLEALSGRRLGFIMVLIDSSYLRGLKASYFEKLKYISEREN